jgi:hypothetical protein
VLRALTEHRDDLARTAHSYHQRLHAALTQLVPAQPPTRAERRWRGARPRSLRLRVILGRTLRRLAVEDRKDAGRPYRNRLHRRVPADGGSVAVSVAVAGRGIDGCEPLRCSRPTEIPWPANRALGLRCARAQRVVHVGRRSGALPLC